MLDGVERSFLFTLNAIDEIQSHYKMTVMEALGKLFDEKEHISALKFFTTTLINDEFEREKSRNATTVLTRITEKEVGWLIDINNIEYVKKAILEAYNISVPEPDENEDPN